MKKLLSLLLCLFLLLTLPAAMAESAPAAKDIVVLFTNDVHCGVDAGLGYAGLWAYRNHLVQNGETVTLVDCGDAIQGEPIGTLSGGSYIIDIMNQVGYDIATPGNHEFDYGMERFLELVGMANFPYVSANFNKSGELVLEPYKILDYDGVKVAYVGVSTPQSITTSTPKYFQDENGEFIYGFMPGDEGNELYAGVQKAVDAARAEGADYVIAIAHLGISAESAPWMSTDLISHTGGIDVVLDGHSHSVIENTLVQDKDGKRVLLTSTGTKFAYVGELRINAEGEITNLLHPWDNDTVRFLKDTAMMSFVNNDTDSFIQGIKGQYEELLSTVVARTEVDLIINEPNVDPPVRIIRVAETNLGDLCADAYRMQAGADVAVVNGGGIRTTIPAGDITYGNVLSVHPYGNSLCLVEATGQEILDALEMGARVVPGENGGFLHVSGMSYEIHTYIESGVQTSDENMFVGVEGEYRVKNVKVGDEPLNLEKVYTFASHDYLIKNGGDGFTMFQDNTLLLDSIMLDNQVLITYITQTLGGVVGEQYAAPYGEGRIIAVPEAAK